MSLSSDTISYLISGMGSTTAGNNLVAAIQNQSTLSANDFKRLQDATEPDVAADIQAAILGTSALSPRDVFFIKSGFSLPDADLANLLANIAGGVQVAPAFPNFLPNSGPNAYPNGFPNNSPVNVNMPAGFSFAVNFVGPAYQQWDAMTFPAGSAFASTGAGKYFELFTGANTNQYYVWYNVSGGSNTDPAPAGFTGIEVTILSSDSASAVATKTNMALSATISPVGGFAILGASAVTNTGSSVLTGDLGVSPGTSITGFPPGVYSGSEHIADGVAAAAQVAAQASFTAKQTLGLAGTTIAAALDGQTLVPGAYKFTGGAATLAASGAGAVTFNGAGTYILYTASTLTTGAGGVPTMNLTGGATAANIYWIVGSSATINSGSAGTFQGSIIAQASITDTLGGTVNGSLIALSGAVTLSAAANVIAPAAGPEAPVMADASSSVSGAVVTVVLAPTEAQAARPKFSLAPGTYHGSQSVALSSATAGAAIYYTLNGSQPTPQSSLYSSPISVASSETIQAIAVLAGVADSAIAVGSYVIM
jgi:type VI secretion system secreted protein VgrG